MVLNLANNTNATAEMIKESLNEPILSGEIIVITEGGGRRRKGGSITPGDQLQFKQSPLLFT
ncbi:hypothetical protein L537_4428 [Bordetella hinzii 1277]|nr:hypothetical protein L537_4428 [Bordetella hinzii 1277]